MLTFNERLFSTSLKEINAVFLLIRKRDRRVTKFSQRTRISAELPPNVLIASMSVLTKMTADNRFFAYNFRHIII